MRIEIRNGCLEVTSDETDAVRKKAERFSRDYAVMRAGLVGGDGTRLTFVNGRTVIEPALKNAEAVRAAMKTDYDKAMRVNEVYFRELDVLEDLP